METICPLDNRYRHKVKDYIHIFSPVSLTAHRLFVMQQWLNEVLAIKGLTTIDFPKQPVLDEKVHQEVEDLEFKVTKHDINALMVYLTNYCKSIGREDAIPYIHFGLTSNDVNSVAYALMVREGKIQVLGDITEVYEALQILAEYDYPMLSHTHGQPATPITFRFAMNVFSERIVNEFENLSHTVIRVKFAGATGGMNTFYMIDNDRDWQAELTQFLKDTFGLERNIYTTQIDHYDEYATIFDSMKRMCVIYLNLVKDIWMYISMGYIIQVPVEKEVGSSTMPHKVNPIQMENAEGNLHIAISLFDVLSRELPQSRMQRDLHDSTMLRNIGMPMAYLGLTMTSIVDGFKRYKPSAENMLADLDKHWEVLAEAVQTQLRWDGRADAYELLKAETRTSKDMDQQSYLEMINRLPLTEESRVKLGQLRPETYLPGY